MKDVATLTDRIAASLNKAKVAREFPISRPMLYPSLGAGCFLLRVFFMSQIRAGRSPTNEMVNSGLPLNHPRGRLPVDEHHP
jgi:hypothetical protein